MYWFKFHWIASKTLWANLVLVLLMATCHYLDQAWPVSPIKSTNVSPSFNGLNILTELIYFPTSYYAFDEWWGFFVLIIILLSYPNTEMAQVVGKVGTDQSCIVASSHHVLLNIFISAFGFQDGWLHTWASRMLCFVRHEHDRYCVC